MVGNGYILLARSIIDSDVFASQKLFKIWIWCLCKANYKDKSISLKVGKGETLIRVKRGSFIFGRHTAEEELDIEGTSIYRAMQKLSSLDMIELEPHNQYTLVTICNYDTYQNPNNYTSTTNEQPMHEISTTYAPDMHTTNKDNNDNKGKEVCGVQPPQNFEEVMDYAQERGYDVNIAHDFFTHFESQNWQKTNGLKITNWKIRLDQWIKDEFIKQQTEKIKHSNGKMTIEQQKAMVDLLLGNYNQ